MLGGGLRLCTLGVSYKREYTVAIYYISPAPRQCSGRLINGISPDANRKMPKNLFFYLLSYLQLFYLLFYKFKFYLLFKLMYIVLCIFLLIELFIVLSIDILFIVLCNALFIALTIIDLLWLGSR